MKTVCSYHNTNVKHSKGVKMTKFHMQVNLKRPGPQSAIPPLKGPSRVYKWGYLHLIKANEKAVCLCVCSPASLTNLMHSKYLLSFVKHLHALTIHFHSGSNVLGFLLEKKTLLNNFHCSGKSEFHPMFCKTQNKVTKRELHKTFFYNDMMCIFYTI